jgi:glycosyltransferase involved in cell wall biosynthesis
MISIIRKTLAGVSALRVLIISNIKGGVFRFTNDLVYGLHKRGIEVERANIFQTHSAYSINPTFLTKAFLGGFDLFHINFASPGLVTILKKQFGKKPYVYTIHGAPNPYIETNHIYKVLYNIEDLLLPTIGKKASKCLVISEYVMKEIWTKYGVDASIIYPGIDIAKYGYKEKWKRQIRKSLDIQDNETVFIFVGRLHKSKDPITLLSAMKILLTHTNFACKLLMIGSGELEGQLKSMVKLDEKLKRNVRFIGEVPPNEVAKYYSAADALVLPSVIEGFGYVLIEAMACPIPVLASTAGACPEVVGDGGIVFKHGDPKELASKLMLLAKDCDLRKKLAARGFERVKKLFTADRMVDEYVAVYESVVRR